MKADSSFQRMLLLCRYIVAVGSMTSLAAFPARADIGDLLFTLIGSDTDIDELFGGSVAISGNRALVGSSHEAAGYLFDVTTGQELHKLTSADAGASADSFGWSVAIYANVALVGAWANDDAGEDSGSAHVFDASTGQELFKLLASDAAAHDRFGFSVAVDGHIAVIGSPHDDGAGESSGAAYLFDANTGQQLRKLTASDAAAGDTFGRAVAISGNIAIVGSPGNSDAGNESGSAYLFDVSTGQELFKLTASTAAANDLFGGAVAISGNTAIVGAHGGNFKTGSAYLFSATTGQELFRLISEEVQAGDFYGATVGISGNTAIVGAEGFGNYGSAFVFDVTTGQEVVELTFGEEGPAPLFGQSVAISGNTAIVGAPHFDVFGVDAGAAYLFRAAPEPAIAVMLALGMGMFVLFYGRRGRLQSSLL